MQPDVDAREVGAADRKLRLLSLYEDIPASVRARRAAGTIARLAGSRWQTASDMWKIDSLTVSEPIKEMIFSDAAKADVIVIALSSLEQRALELVQWLDSLAAREPKRSVPALLIAMLGGEENKPKELDWTVKQLMRCAQQTDRNFIWHWVGEGAMDGSDWLTDSVEVLLARKLAANNEVVFC
jgi:hypothetical protein